MTNDEYWFWLCNIEEIWQQDIKRLFTVFNSPEEIFNAPAKLISDSKKLSAVQVKNLIDSRKDLASLNKLGSLEKDHIRFIHKDSSEYPDRFKCIPDAPYSFYLKGRLPDPDSASVGIVGARACSGYGRETTLEFSAKLAEYGIQIVSGMAHGIDACSAQGALRAGGNPFAVLGSGVDVIYPRENTELYYQILLSGGIISEYPPGTPPVAWQFPHRNRLIAGLSDVLLVMEARKRSGTLITANYALEQGKEIFALPGRVDDPLSTGCNSLIADGAGILLDPLQIIEHIQNAPAALLEHSGKENTLQNIDLPDPVYKKILACTGRYAKGAQQLMQESRCSPEETSAALTWLQLNGLIEEISTDYYIKTI